MLANIFTNLTSMIRQNLERAIQEELAARTLQAEMELERHRALGQMAAGARAATSPGIINTAASVLKRYPQPRDDPRLARDVQARFHAGGCR